MRLLVALCVLVGCAEHRVATSPETLAAASRDLRAYGEATIEVTEGDETSSSTDRRTALVRASDEVEVELDLGQGASKIIELRIDKLLADCAGAEDDEPCLLARTRGQVVLERRQRTSKLVVASIVGGVVFSGAITCSFACDAPWSTASRWTAGGVAIVGLASLAFVYLVAHSVPGD